MAHLPDLGPRLCRARLIPRAWAGFPAGYQASATTEPDEATLTSSMLVSFFIPGFVDPMISTAMAEVKGGWLSRNERKPRTVHRAEVLAGEG